MKRRKVNMKQRREFNMLKRRLENPPAFPREDYQCNGGRGNLEQEGMNLRDYFAGQVLAGFNEIATEDELGVGFWHEPKKIANRCYLIADAMLKVREATND